MNMASNLPTSFTIPYISASQLVHHKGPISLPPTDAGWGLGQKSYQTVQRPWVTHGGAGCHTNVLFYMFLHHNNRKASK